MTTQCDRALAAFRAGAVTSRDIERVLGITFGHAKVLVHDMRCRGLIEPRGFTREKNKPGRGSIVYVVTE